MAKEHRDGHAVQDRFGAEFILPLGFPGFYRIRDILALKGIALVFILGIQGMRKNCVHSGLCKDDLGYSPKSGTP